MPTEKICVIINPASAAGRTGRNIGKITARLKDILGPVTEILITRAPGEATEFARSSANGRFGAVVAVGGDGTINEVVNGIYKDDKPVNPDLRLGVIASGTSSGLAQSLDFPKSMEDQIGIIKSKRTRAIDIGRITYQASDPSSAGRYFVNECQIGIGGTIVKKVAKSHKFFGGRIAFGWVTLLETFRDSPKRINLSVDGNQPETIFIHGMTAANGIFMGGGMKLAPGALLDDGLLDLLLIHEQGIVRRFYSYSKIYSGKHVGSDRFSYIKCSRISLTSDDLVHVGADGEILGTAPCEIRIIPRSLAISAP